MTQLRVMSAEAFAVSQTFEPFTRSKNDNIQTSAQAARDAVGIYKGLFDQTSSYTSSRCEYSSTGRLRWGRVIRKPDPLGMGR